MMYGELREGEKALTVIALPRGRFRTLTLFCDSTRQDLYATEIRVALYHCEYGFQAERYHLDGTKGPLEITFKDPEHIGGISIERQKQNDVHIAWAVV
jgi:hypothetical protein